MARMTAQDFVDYTRKRMGNPSTDEWTNDDILRFVNMAQQRVALGSAVATLETYEDVALTEAAGATYEFTATDIMYITSVKNLSTGQRIKPTDRESHTTDTQSPDAIKGDVYRYFESGLGSNSRKQVVFQHAPDASFSVRVYYLAYPTELVLTPTATSSELPLEYDEAILDYAAEIGKKFDQQMSEAGVERNMAKETEGRASAIAPKVPERRYGIKSSIASETAPRDK